MASHLVWVSRSPLQAHRPVEVHPPRALATGQSLECELPSPRSDEDYVKDLWEKDDVLAKLLQTNWPSFLYGKSEQDFWIHEWEAHGYCTKQALPAADYFRGAMRFAAAKETGKGKGKNKGVLGDVRNKLVTAGMLGSNDETAYDMTDIRTVLSKVTPTNIYISCIPKNVTFVFLKEIHFCLDKTLKKFMDCPASLDTRGCGGKTKQSNIIIPNKAIYGVI